MQVRFSTVLPTLFLLTSQQLAGVIQPPCPQISFFQHCRSLIAYLWGIVVCHIWCHVVLGGSVPWVPFQGSVCPVPRPVGPIPRFRGAHSAGSVGPILRVPWVQFRSAGSVPWVPFQGPVCPIPQVPCVPFRGFRGSHSGKLGNSKNLKIQKN